MSKDKVQLDGGAASGGARSPLVSSVLLPDGPTRCKFTELLLQQGASVNQQDGTGRTALSYACERGHLDAVKILVRHNADPEIGDLWGNTALMYAAVAGHTPVVDFLVRAFKRLGLQIDRQNRAGNSAVEVAKFLGHTECTSALTNSSKRRRESAQPRGALQGDTERKVSNLAHKLEILQTHDGAQSAQSCSLKAQRKLHRFPSMDSIEEFDTDDPASSFSAPPSRDYSHYPDAKRVTTSEVHLPPLINTRLAPPPPTHDLSASSPLSILLTPIFTERVKEKSFRMRRFNDAYYKKRCSLPTSVLTPTPPERALGPVRKFKTLRRQEESRNFAGALEFTTPAPPAATSSLSTLSNRLFRRFTSPEFKHGTADLEQDPVLPSRRIPRSETFPQAARHAEVDSTPSINSISSVKCEFDLQPPQKKP